MENISLPLEITPKLAEEVGWHIGDGSMNFYKNHGKLKGLYQLRGHIEDDKEHYLIRIKPIFKLLYNIDLNLREMSSTRVFGFQIWSNKLVNFKTKLGLPLGKKLSVSIPETFLKDDRLKIAVIRGIFDTDGGIQLAKKYNKLYPIVYIDTISYELNLQLLEIFKQIGLRATSYGRLDPRGNRQKIYKIMIRGNEMFDKFMNIIKPKNPKHINKYFKFKESFK